MKHLWNVELKSTTYGLFGQNHFWDKPIVVFNSASFCGFTNQLMDFETVYQSGKIVPIAIPTNNFDEQEPGHIYEINQHYKKRFNVTYPIVDKTTIEHKFFKVFGTPEWNFNKWLFDSKHNFVRRFDSKTNPMELVNHV
jgi:glutathione peroxidase